MLLQFPRHVRASAGSFRTSAAGRAAQSVIIWAVTPAWPARSVDRIGDHHSAGILSRCHHFDTAGALAPMSDAMPSLDGQSSISERNDVGFVMANHLRQSVLNGKTNVSRACGRSLGQNVLMDRPQSESEYKAAFLGRVRAARKSRFKAQEDLCEVLGLAQPKYGKYEVRSLMPHSLVPRFCLACGVSTDWLFGLKGAAGPAWEPVYAVPKPRKAPRRARKYG